LGGRVIIKVLTPYQTTSSLFMIETNKERQAPQKVEDTEPTHLARYQFALNYVNGDDIVLDVPCGSGYGANLLSKKAKKVIGIDVHEGAIKHAKEFFQKDNIEFFTHDAEELSGLFVDQNLFDVVVSLEGIEHVSNPNNFLNEIRKNINPHGKLIISTPRKPHGSPYHNIEFSLDEFRDVLSKEFKIDAMYGQIYTDIFDLRLREEDPYSYKKFNFIAECSLKKF